jgi:hypothetical protein
MKTKRGRRRSRRRSKSPSRPKIPTFSGKEDNWSSFVFQFERVANCQDWSHQKKGSRLIDCLTARQKEEESIEDFVQRVYFLTLDSHPEAHQCMTDEIAVEVFLHGSKDKHAAEITMEKEPRN